MKGYTCGSMKDIEILLGEIKQRRITDYRILRSDETAGDEVIRMRLYSLIIIAKEDWER